MVDGAFDHEGIHSVTSLNHKLVREREDLIAYAIAFSGSCCSEYFLSVARQERHDSMLVFITVISVSP